MPLRRRLLGISARGLHRFHSTAAATLASDSSRGQYWSWYMLAKSTMAVRSAAPGPSVAFANPPCVSRLQMPEHFLAKASRSLPPDPEPEGDLLRFHIGEPCCSSQDGLLLLTCEDKRVAASVFGKQEGNRERRLAGITTNHIPDRTHFIFNPCTREISPPLPEAPGPRPRYTPRLGLLTRADGGCGPPDRYAVAMMEGRSMLRFLSGTGKWETVGCSPSQLQPVRRIPYTRGLVPNQETVAWKDMLWWVDVTWGAFFVDPFSDRPEARFVELPSDSVLPADAFEKVIHQWSQLPDAKEDVWWLPLPVMYRRVGVSGGWLRYVEVSQEEPFVLSSFAIAEDCSSWKLEHRVALSRIWADRGHPWLPLRAEKTPQIGVLDPFDSNVVHLIVGEHVVVVDMEKGEVIGHCLCKSNTIVPCVLSPWLPTTRIPSAGKKDVTKRITLADVLVRSDRRRDK